MGAEISGAWDRQTVDDYLIHSSYPLRLACVGGDGFPRVVSLWFQYFDGRFFCVSHENSSLVKLLANNGKVGFEVATNTPPYFGVRGQGEAWICSDSAGPRLEELLQRYLGGSDSRLGAWLLSRSDEEKLIQINPARMFSWDYRQRMSDVAAVE